MKGHTLLELVLGMGLLVLLMTAMFFLYQMGASAWKKGETQTELLQQAQMVTGRLEREVERSVYAATVLDPGPSSGTAVSLLSCWDEAAQRYDYDPATRSPVWHRYQICYFDAGAGVVYWKDVPLAPPSTTPLPMVGLAGQRTDGRVLARNVVTCDFRLSEQVLELQLALEKKRYGSQGPERIEVPATAMFRN